MSNKELIKKSRILDDEQTQSFKDKAKKNPDIWLEIYDIHLKDKSEDATGADKQAIENELKDVRKRLAAAKKKEKQEEEKFEKSIIDLLKKHGTKMPASDIDAHLRHQNVDEVKEYCEKMYLDGEISRTGNYRYFILSEEKKKPKPKKASAPKSEEVDVEKELEKLKARLDKGLITQEQAIAKSNALLGKKEVNSKQISSTVPQEIDIEKDGISRDTLVKLTGGYTVPQIIINDKSIGGFDNLLKLNQEGKLKDRNGNS